MVDNTPPNLYIEGSLDSDNHVDFIRPLADVFQDVFRRTNTSRTNKLGSMKSQRS